MRLRLLSYALMAGYETALVCLIGYPHPANSVLFIQSAGFHIGGQAHVRPEFTPGKEITADVNSHSCYYQFALCSGSGAHRLKSMKMFTVILYAIFRWVDGERTNHVPARARTGSTTLRVQGQLPAAVWERNDIQAPPRRFLLSTMCRPTILAGVSDFNKGQCYR